MCISVLYGLTLHIRPITFFETSCTLADASATAVSAIISIIGDPRPVCGAQSNYLIKFIIQNYSHSYTF